jgi:integrase
MLHIGFLGIVLETDNNISFEGRVVASKKNQGRDTSTFKGLIDEYIEIYAKPKKMSWHEDLRILNKDVLPKWKYLPTPDITKQDVTKLLDRIGKSGGVPNKIFKVLQSIFVFAVSRCIMKTNPCSDIEVLNEDIQKERILKADEIRRIWFGLEKTKMSEPMRSVLKFLLVTGQRNGEVAGAKWDEFNLRDKWWTIPGARTKNKKNHQVFLTPMVIDVLGQVRSHGWVFPSVKDKHIAPRSVSLAIRNNSEKRTQKNSTYGDFFKVGQFVPNDLRRTAAALMAEAGVDETPIAKVMNQTRSDKTRDPEIRQALEVWEKKLQMILYGWRKHKPVTNSSE